MAEYTSFFRCYTCGRAIEMNEFLAKQRSKCCCGGGRFVPTILSPFEICKYLFAHPKVLYETILGRIKSWQQK